MLGRCSNIDQYISEIWQYKDYFKFIKLQVCKIVELTGIVTMEIIRDIRNSQCLKVLILIIKITKIQELMSNDKEVIK